MFRWLLGARPAKKRRRARFRRLATGGQALQLAPGLSRKAAYRAASKKAKADFRGFTYNPRTGRARIT